METQLKECMKMFCILWLLTLLSCQHRSNEKTVAASGESDSKPNIIFIMVDDLGKEWISCYGADSIVTPAIDQLADEGMKFHNAWSMPQCTPSRLTLLTGTYPWRHGWVNHWDVPRWGHGYFDWKSHMTFANYLQDAGYKTAVAGKWQINDFRLTPDAMRKHGFDEWLMWTGYEEGIPASAERYWDPYIASEAGSKTYQEAFGPDMFTDFLIQFMEDHRESPMMLYYPMVLTHTPFVNTPDEPDTKGTDRHKSMVRYTDKLIGKIMKGIRDLNLDENTLVIFTTDNGTTRSITGHREGRPVKGGKATKWESGICEPFIARWVGKITPGSATMALTDFTDLLPTFLDMAGVSSTSKPIDGISFLPVLLGENEVASRDWIMALGHGPACLDQKGIRGVSDYADRVIRDETYKAWTEHSSKITKLFNLKLDPFEEVNLLKNLSAEDRIALDKLQSLLSAMPQEDARPRYEHRDANIWDVKNLLCKDN